MERIQYKTDIRNEAALRSVAPFLDTMLGKSNWQIDMSSRDKTLTLYSAARTQENQVLHALYAAGFRVVNLEDYYSIY